MTIEDEGLQGAPTTAAPQAINNEDDLKSLVRILADRSAELTERVALLERGTDNTIDDADELPSRRVSFAPTSSRSIVTGRISNDLEVTPDDNNLNVVTGILEKGNNNNNNDDEEAIKSRISLLEQRMDDYDDEKDILIGNSNSQGEYHLAESTHSLLITEPITSLPFMFGVFSIALSISCLCLVLTSSIKKGTSRNRLGIPAGVDGTTRAAQFLGALVGVLMEDEIPQGLQSIANAAGHQLFLNGQQQKEVRMRVLISSFFRLAVGYLFLSALFLQISQNRDVIEIFYDVLALEFVENIDDTTFALCKRGFFGRRMLFATNQKRTLQMAEMRDSFVARGAGGNRGTLDSQVQADRRLSYRGLIAGKTRVNLLVKTVYFLNAIIMLVGLGYISKTQHDGKFRTRSIRIIFDEEIWEKANVLIGGDIFQRLLIYSYFNGVYEEEGSYGGYPRYVERSKNQIGISLNENAGDTFFGPDNSIPGAEIVYCQDVNSWVFRHPNIITSANGEEGNECQWLWKSSESDDYDILSTNEGVWHAWVGSNGKVKPHVTFSVTSNECSERSDCNYHGQCIQNHCNCDIGYFGEACQFDWPCDTLATEKAHTLDDTRGMVWKMENPIRRVQHFVYNRPIYIQKGLTGEPYDMRLFKILELERSESPSNQPSSVPSTPPSSAPTLKPSLSQQPSAFPSQEPSLSAQPTTFPSVSIKPTKAPTISPSTSDVSIGGFDITTPPTIVSTSGSTPTVGGFGNSAFPTEFGAGAANNHAGSSADDEPLPIGPPIDEADTETITFEENEYDTAPDFADVDDFFERKPLHDLEDILEDYSVVLTFTGSRFYGTIIQSNASLDDLYPDNYHGFWDESFNVNRTFIISDTTFDSSPVGVDFYEMRRRINELLNPDIHFSYGPYGAMIPLMDYEGVGFFHCMDETADPSVSPTFSTAPSLQPSISAIPTDPCFDVEVNIFTDCCPGEISWTISKEVLNNGDQDQNDEAELIAKSEIYWEEDTLSVSKVCLLEGNYTFTIRDSYGDGIFDPGYYSVTSNGIEIKRGGGSNNGFQEEETVSFSVPVLP